MFANLKNKLIEEVKASPSKFFTQSSQVRRKIVNPLLLFLLSHKIFQQHHQMSKTEAHKRWGQHKAAKQLHLQTMHIFAIKQKNGNAIFGLKISCCFLFVCRQQRHLRRLQLLRKPMRQIIPLMRTFLVLLKKVSTNRRLRRGCGVFIVKY